MAKKIAKNDWRRQLHNGDEIVIDTGDNEKPPSIIIATIEYLPADLARIVSKDGQSYECHLKEIS